MSASSSSTLWSCCRCAIRVQVSRSSLCLRSSSVTTTTYLHRRRKFHTTSRRLQDTSTAAAAAVTTSPKISSIVDQISQLTLLETADLVASLKSRLNIPDISFAAPSSGGPASSGPAAAAAPAEEDEPAPAAQEKTLFTLKLQSFEAAAKPKIIKEVKSMLGLSLVDSKKFVESAPKVLKEGVPKEEAEKMVANLKALGAVVAME